MEFREIIAWMDWATIVFAFGAMFFSARNWWNARKQLKPIKIIIERNGEQKIIPFEIIRKNFSRAELFGILGAFDKDSKFNIKYTSSKDFFQQISDIQESKKDKIIIYVSNSDKFDWN